MSNPHPIERFAATLLLAAVTCAAQAQTDAAIMPFLCMPTDARTAGMAAATAVDDNPLAIYANAATAPLAARRAGAAIFSGPWNRSFDGADVLYGAGGFYSPDARSSVLFGVRYLCGPSVPLTDERGFSAGRARPADLSAEIGCARRTGRNLALALTARYARSDPGFGEKPMHGFSFDLGAAWRGTLRAVDGARWIVGLRLADIGPGVKAADGKRYALPLRASLGGSLRLPFSSNHLLAAALDLGHRFRGAVTELGAGLEYTFFRHGVVRGGCHVEQRSKGTGSYASVGCGFVAGPLRCDAAWRVGGDRLNPRNNTFLFSVGFLL